MRKNDMNLLESYQSLEKIRKSQSKDSVIYLAIILALILLLGAYAGKLFIDRQLKDNEIADLNSFLQSAGVAEKIVEAKKVESNLIGIDKVESELKEINTVLDFIPVYDHRILDIVHQVMPNNPEYTIHYTKFSYEQNTVTIEYYEHESPSASAFALKLLNSGIFEDVSYTGYQYDNVDKVYRGKIVAIVKGGQ